MEMNHFGHEHKLILLEEVENVNNTDDHIRRSRICNCCSDPIFATPGAYYSCSNDCEFFLHKYCAELPREIQHPLHSEHPLLLLSEREYREYECDGCDNDGENFSYSCSLCYFDLDVFCAGLIKPTIEHKNHRHPLLRLRKPGLFNCNACNTEHRGIFYHCSSTCPSFFIHEDCLSLPNTINHADHAHPLVLLHSRDNSRFRYYCDICHEYIYRPNWLYCCESCRYFVHVNCATSKNEPFMSILLPWPPEDTEEEDESPSIDLIHFPVSDQSVTLISYMRQRVSVTDDIDSTTAAYQELLNHFSHEHPLLLDMRGSSDMESKLCLPMNDTRVNETICNACVKPIFETTPFYRCSLQCSNFFLHKCCAELPDEILHPYHIDDHPLKLLHKSSTSLNLFKCQGCHMYCNGFSYNCSRCDDFNLDVQCGSLPFTITHEDHNHVLSLRGRVSKRCNSCYDKWEEPILAYDCKICDFVLDSCCVLSASKVRHRYNKHPFILTYRPVEGHSDDYYCELCEGALNPKNWFYHCTDSDKSIHIKCLRPFYRWSNIKYDGGSYKIQSHPHPLALGPVIEDDTKFNDSLQVIIQDTKCNKCGTLFNNSPQKCPPNPFGFRCDKCNFVLCYKCAKSSDEEDHH